MISKLNKLLSAGQQLSSSAYKLLSIKLLSTAVPNPQKMACADIVWIDLEMTGLDVIEDKIIEVAMLITDKDLNIIAEGPQFAINPPPNVFETMNDWCKDHHNKSGLVQNCLESQITTAQGEQILLDFLKKNAPKGHCPLAGNSVYIDRLFLRQHMPRVDDYMHYRIIDVSSIKELARLWYPEILNGAPGKKFAHRSLDDIKDSLNELKYYRKTLFKDVL